MAKQSDRHLTRDLIQNSESFLQEAVRHARSDKKRDWVFVIVNLTTALELALKAILRNEHWSLLFEDIREASEETMQKGKFKSVSLTEALRRSRDIAGVHLEQKDEKYLEDLRDFRNQVLHYEFTLNIEQVKGIVARGLNTFNTLYLSWIDPNGTLPEEISRELASFDRYVKQRMRLLEPQLKAAGQPPLAFRECAKCFQPALTVQDGYVRCLFCGAQTTAAELAEIGEIEGGPCPQCEEGRLAFVLVDNENGHFECVLCGFQSDTDRTADCSHCDETFWDEEGIGVCPRCFQAMVEDED